MSHRDDIAGHGNVQKLKQSPGGSWTGCSADWILNSQRRSRPSEKSIVKSTKFSRDISDENVDNSFSFHLGRDISCVFSISSLFLVFCDRYNRKCLSLSSLELLSASVIHRHYDELPAVTSSLFSSIFGKIPVTKQRSEGPWHPLQGTSSSRN